MAIVLFSKPWKLWTIRNPKISLHSEHELARTRRLKAINIQIWKELRLWSEKTLEEDKPVSHTLIQTKRARETERDCLCLWKWRRFRFVFIVESLILLFWGRSGTSDLLGNLEPWIFLMCGLDCEFCCAADRWRGYVIERHIFRFSRFLTFQLLMVDDSPAF